MPSEPVDQCQTRIKVSHPVAIKLVSKKGVASSFNFPNFGNITSFYLPNFTPVVEEGKTRIRIDFDILAKRLERAGVKSNWEVTLEIAYPDK